MVKPVIAIVGRPNVGKSTLFNRLLGRRQALVHDVPGVTRDRLYGVATFDRWQGTFIDTGGFDPISEHDLISAVRRQVLHAIREADLIVFVVDGRVGVTPLDSEIAGVLRRARRPLLVAVNKMDGPGQDAHLGEFFELGFEDVMAVSAEHGRGVAELLEAVRDRTGRPEVEHPAEGLRVAIIGRPNVGKSSLINALLGTDRLLVHRAPGTTRDAVDTPFTFRGRRYLLIDTAGIRRKGRVSEPLEKLAVVMALKSVERCQVAVVVLDGSEGVTAQDAHIAGYAHEAGRATVLAVNKWDLAPRGPGKGQEMVAAIRDRLSFLDYAPVAFTSALTGLGLADLFDLVDRVGAEATKRLPAARVTKVLAEAMERRPVTPGGQPLLLQSATQVASAPPTFVLRINQPDKVHFSYQRYLVNALRQAFGFAGSPVRLAFRRARIKKSRR